MIETRGLGFAYPQAPVLRFPDVAVPQGGTLLLRGPSGSGKSTWLALVAGLLTPSSGEVVVAGQAVQALAGAPRDRWRARTLGFLPQKLFLSEALSVADNLGLVFFAEPKTAFVQARFDFLNPHENALTEMQMVTLDAHLGIEQHPTGVA